MEDNADNDVGPGSHFVLRPGDAVLVVLLPPPGKEAEYFHIHSIVATRLERLRCHVQVLCCAPSERMDTTFLQFLHNNERRFTVIHFEGHTVNTQDGAMLHFPAANGARVENAPELPWWRSCVLDKLRDLNKLPSVAVLSACNTLELGELFAQYVPAVVVTRRAVTTVNVLPFVEEFYSCMALGLHVHGAFISARERAIREAIASHGTEVAIVMAALDDSRGLHTSGQHTLSSVRDEGPFADAARSFQILCRAPAHAGGSELESTYSELEENPYPPIEQTLWDVDQMPTEGLQWHVRPSKHEPGRMVLEDMLHPVMLKGVAEPACIRFAIHAEGYALFLKGGVLNFATWRDFLWSRGLIDSPRPTGGPNTNNGPVQSNIRTNMFMFGAVAGGTAVAVVWWWWSLRWTGLSTEH